MLFATFKHHQSDFQLKVNDKFACVKLALKDSHHFIARLGPLPLPLTSERYLYYKESMFLHTANPKYLHILCI